MPSWQARFISFVLRVFVKRRLRVPIDPAAVRRQVRTAWLSRKLLARIGRFLCGAALSEGVTEAASNPVSGDRVDVGPDSSPRADFGVLYLHGGGYFFCSAQTHRPLTLGLADALGAPVWAPDYRLAPESPYPAALDDALSTYRHLLASEPARRWVLAGDSAGGGLALALATRIRDQGLAMPVALALYSPWTDLSCSGESLTSNGRSCAFFTEASVRSAARFYVGTAAPDHPEISPLFARLDGLPPMIIFAGAEEALLDDSTRLAARAREAGVRVQFECVPGVPHAYPLFRRVLPEGRAALRLTADFVASLGPAAPAASTSYVVIS